jgi:hypothetical protein
MNAVRHAMHWPRLLNEGLKSNYAQDSERSEASLVRKSLFYLVDAPFLSQTNIHSETDWVNFIHFV